MIRKVKPNLRGKARSGTSGVGETTASKRRQANSQLVYFDIDGMWVADYLVCGFISAKSITYACQEARDIYEIKLIKGSQPPVDQPISTLKRMIYQIGILILKFENTALLMEAAQELVSKHYRTAEREPDGR